MLTESLSRRDGKGISQLGHYEPLKKTLCFNRAELHKCIENGAQPTDTVRHLIYRALKEKTL